MLLLLALTCFLSRQLISLAHQLLLQAAATPGCLCKLHLWIKHLQHTKLCQFGHYFELPCHNLAKAVNMQLSPPWYSSCARQQTCSALDLPAE